MSAMAGLRAATWASHQKLEKRLDVKSRFSDLDAYRTHIEGMWGFCAGLEQRLETELAVHALPDYAVRRKLPLLNADLTALGADPDAVRGLPRCEKLPDRADLAASFGCARNTSSSPPRCRT